MNNVVVVVVVCQTPHQRLMLELSSPHPNNAYPILHIPFINQTKPQSSFISLYANLWKTLAFSLKRRTGRFPLGWGGGTTIWLPPRSLFSWWASLFTWCPYLLSATPISLYLVGISPPCHCAAYSHCHQPQLRLL